MKTEVCPNCKRVYPCICRVKAHNCTKPPHFPPHCGCPA